ncbi:hypothetical protein GPECTOR_40g541 [Gonium pectorale]|uniref:Polysaccharide pyruvyl transferase domain-containing protein n=1 Tax=Gonium pectorale TaxID=33097 RepID=A0A150GAD1_GONPE|nr:hypothetical protein GPECTOR_40g541 [Gonium pectorale]|eukprot:KXZ46807.1 hypothetical protein GPECTOR_40g541 [Gonium pectorale]
MIIAFVCGGEARVEWCKHGDVDLFLLGTANLFSNISDYNRVGPLTKLLIDKIHAFRAPVLMVGLGAQADFSDGLPFRAKSRIEKPPLRASDIVLHAQQKEMYGLIKSSGGDVTVRGQFTADVCTANGLRPPLVLGCPSLFINHNPSLGALLEEKRNAVLRARDANVRIAVGLPAVPTVPSAGGGIMYNQSRTLIQFLADKVFKVFPRSFVVVQTPHDLDTIRALQQYGAPITKERIKYYYDPEHWFEGIRESSDFLFGFRVHGTMAGTVAEVPSVVISTDHRIQELAEGMQLATTTLSDPRFDVEPFDLFTFIESVKFDGAKFDEHRRIIAKQYVALFGRLEVPVNPGIEAIANSVDGRPRAAQ